MAEEEKPRNKGGRPRKHPVGTRIPTLAFRVRAGLRDRIEESATRNERSISEEIEARIERSFLDEETTIPDLRQKLEALEEWDRLLWRTESDRVAARIFALAIHQCQLAGGSPWREDASIAATIGKATGETLGRFARVRGGVLSQLIGPVEDAALARAVSDDLFDFYKDAMPPLPSLRPEEDQAHRNGMARVVVTLKDKATGQVVDTLEGPAQPLSEMKGRQVPGLVEFTDRHRANKDSLDVDFAIVHVLRDEGSIWDAREPEA